MNKRTTKEQIRSMRLAGLNVRKIAEILGISTQAVYQHLHSLDMAPTKAKS